ncbi:HAMP domain-containing histidine kinase [Cohnella sp. CBP 2801]|uniref:histidine kinase n=1 Tax=Cohnella zeiphila TaxID=2761120 RepID=A0A7X0VUV3_9BACL|nr:HAMP domain-containing histidine kinase [Cohnella zeiphila]
MGIAAAAVLTAAFCLLRLAAVRREVRSFAAQLGRYNRHETASKLSVGLSDRATEALAVEINRHTELIAEANAERRRTEDELRQAVANMSHDLRTPLTSISGYIQLLESRELSAEERRAALEVVKKRTNRLQALLADFFELSVIESVDYALKPERVALHKLIPEILMGFYDSLNEKGLNPTFELTEEAVDIYADESAVRRVVENLMQNAIRHAEGELIVTLSRTERHAAFTLSNAAPGLKGTNPELLFNRFYMADRSRSGSGSGLGLSIARGLMLKMGGSLAAKLQGDNLVMRCEWERI